MIEVDDVDGEPHADSMNAAAGNDPEAVSITEVTGSQTQEASKASPVRIGDSKRRGQIGLTSSIESLPLRRKDSHIHPLRLCFLATLRPSAARHRTQLP